MSGEPNCPHCNDAGVVEAKAYWADCGCPVKEGDPGFCMEHASISKRMPTGKEVADRWFDQFGAGMRQSRTELAAMIDEALRETAKEIKRLRRNQRQPAPLRGDAEGR